jgi:hypothetical protein
MALAAKSKRTTKIHDKRRSGRHHKQNDNYLKTYWPYLPLLLIVSLGVTLNSVWGSAHKGVLGYATDMSIGSLLQDTNDQRGSNSLGALTINDQLDSAAQAKANDMAARNYWSHNTPDGNTPWTFITNAGYNYQTAGENLAYGFDTSADTITGWMNSPEHRANILNTTYKDVGFGIANAANYQGSGPETIVVAEYGSQQTIAAAPATSSSSQPAPSAPVAAPAPVATPAPTPTPTTPIPPAEANSTPAVVVKKGNKTIAVKPMATATHNITRIQLLSDSRAAPWSVFAMSTIATISIAIFLLRHGLLWHRALIKGERFIMKHKFLDIALVAIGVVGLLLTRTAGVIH